MAVQNSLARQDQSMKLSVYLQNDAVKKQINQVVGGKNGTRFISSIVSAVQSTPALQECTSPSIVIPEDYAVEAVPDQYQVIAEPDPLFVEVIYPIHGRGCCCEQN